MIKSSLTHSLTAFLAVTFLGTSLLYGESAEPVPSGMIEYPARGNIQLDEGTVEIYLTTLSDVSEPPQPKSLPLWELNLKDSDEKITMSYIPDAKRFAVVGYVRPVQHSWVISHKEGQPGITWKSGEYHVIAFTWKGDRRQIYVDGIPGDDTKVESSYQLNPAKCTIQLGGMFNASWQIDEIRISSVRRTAEELRQGIASAPQPDIYTLLLDHFDADTPEVQQGNPATGIRQQTGKALPVRGRLGGALSLGISSDPASTN